MDDQRTSDMTLPIVFIALLSLSMLSGCPSGSAAKKIRSEQPTVAQEEPVAPEECDASKSYDTQNWRARAV